MYISKADILYRNIIPSCMFEKGWGKPEVIKRIVTGRKQILSSRDKAVQLLNNAPPVIIEKKEVGKRVILEGHFRSPYANIFPGLLPEVAETARFKAFLPLKWEDGKRRFGNEIRPLCLCLAGTGDHGYILRTNTLSNPLLDKGIGTILLENPYYGSRKPEAQIRSNLQYVSDLWIMGGALMLEASVLLNWCEEQGYGPLCIQGTSMGGFMACLAASIWPKPVSLVPCLSWSTASNVYTKGILSKKISWDVLKSQYFNDRVYADSIKPLLESGERHNPHTKSVMDGHQIHNDLDSISSKYSDPDLVSDHEKMQGTFSDLGEGIGDKPVRAAFTKLGLASLAKTYQSVSDVKSKSFVRDGSDQVDITERRASTYNLFQLPVSIFNNMRKVEDMKAGSFSRNDGSGRVHSSRKTYREPLGCEVMDFMRMSMDDLTHLANYSKPVDPSLIVALVAAHDAYVRREGVMDLKDLWPECETKYLERGHMTSIMTRSAFISSILEALEKNRQKYYQHSEDHI